MAAAARVAETALRDARPEEAAELARRVLAVNPLDLRAHELLVSALLDTDQLDAARSAHAAWAEAGDELGTDVPPLAPA